NVEAIGAANPRRPEDTKPGSDAGLLFFLVGGFAGEPRLAQFRGAVAQRLLGGAVVGGGLRRVRLLLRADYERTLGAQHRIGSIVERHIGQRRVWGGSSARLSGRSPLRRPPACN